MNGFPYPHRTIAEIDAARRRMARMREGLEFEPEPPADARATLPAVPCPRCNARGWCGHAGRVDPNASTR